MEETGSYIEELPESYSATETKELDQFTRALGRDWISKYEFLVHSPSSGREDVAESLKRLYDRGYLTNREVQNTMKLFGGWPK